MTGQEKLTIPGEPRLAQRLREAAGRDALGHAVILSGQGDLTAAARFTAAAMECQGADRPCGVCGPCRKVLRDIHPDVITVVDPEHKNIAIDVLRDMAADAYTLPNEGRRKIYIFPDCGLLDPKAQNVLLKVVEDGPAHAAFLFCAANSAVLLPTIRSRAVEWKLSPPQETAEADGDAQELCRLLCEDRTADIAAYFARLESGKITREELARLLSDARDLVVKALAAACGGGGAPAARQLAQAVGPRRLSQIADLLGKYALRCRYNIGPGHLTGALAAELTERG